MLCTSYSSLFLNFVNAAVHISKHYTIYYGKNVR